jgi:hypothetical protein
MYGRGTDFTFSHYFVVYALYIFALKNLQVFHSLYTLTYYLIYVKTGWYQDFVGILGINYSLCNKNEGPRSKGLQ